VHLGWIRVFGVLRTHQKCQILERDRVAPIGRERQEKVEFLITLGRIRFEVEFLKKHASTSIYVDFHLYRLSQKACINFHLCCFL
jgi:hypothetical protein